MKKMEKWERKRKRRPRNTQASPAIQIQEHDKF